MTVRTVTTIVLAAALASAASPALAQRSTAAGRRGAAAAKPPAPPNPKLRNPALLKEVAPPEYQATFDTSAGTFVVAVHRDWAPKGADRFHNLVKYGFYDGCRFFRVIPNFMVQWGIHGIPSIQAAWRDANITDEPVKHSNTRGTISFAKAAIPNSRTTQVFINFRNNAASLDPQGFAAFGEVVSGMEVVDKINGQYGEQPEQPLIQRQGNVYLNRSFPNLDYIKSARITSAPAGRAGRGGRAGR